MPSYPSNFVSGAARGTTSTNNVTERFELRIGQQTTVASAVTLTNVRVATTVDDGVAVTFNVGDVVTIDVIVVVYAGILLLMLML